jgi:tRNA-specific 2-thiouridylase
LSRNSTSVLVALSGGVDSSAAAALLLEQGYRVGSLTLLLAPTRTAPEPGAGEGGEAVSAEVAGEAEGAAAGKTEEAAKAVAAHLGIKHHILDARDLFKKRVVDPFSRDYLSGLTPNPCICCNPLVKFKLLAAMADKLGYERIATGHYARACPCPGHSSPGLFRGTDPAKDQSYFLYRLSSEQLARSLFPLGAMTKEQVRSKALGLDLPVHREESQEICFLPDKNYRAFFADSLTPGPILDEQGRRIGTHRGIAGYTVGQRRGLGISSARPLYVKHIDAGANTLVVGERRSVLSSELTAVNLNWLTRPPEVPLRIEAQIRSIHRPARALLTPHGNRVLVKFDSPQWAVTPGQSAVFYSGDQVLGGGIIAEGSDTVTGTGGLT